jgi:glycosyltransferase involved in cell wall biosynthesis
MSQMRTVFVSTGSQENGTNYRILGLARSASKLGIDAHIILPGIANNFAWLPESHYDGVPIHFTSPNALNEFKEKYALLCALKPQFVHCVAVSIRCFPACFAYRIMHRCELIIDLDEHMSRIKLFGWRRRALFLAFEFLAKHRADRLIVASRFLEKLFGGRKRQKVLYLPNGVDLELFEQQRLGWETLKRQWGSCKVVTYFGTLSSHYDADMVLEAAERILATRHDLVFLFVGGGEMLKPFRERINRSGLDDRIHFCGFVPDEAVPKYLCASDAFVFPIRDNWWNKARCPLKVYSFVAAMVPIVTNAVGEVSEALGDKAWYFKDGDIDDFIRVLEECLALGRNGPCPDQTMVDRHSWKARAEEYTHFLRDEPAGVSK